MAAWIEDYVAKNQFSRPGLPLLAVKAVILHWTATPGATDENEKKFFDGADGGGSRYASAHMFVDRDSARLVIPLNEVAYHANEKPSKVTRLLASASYYKGGNANLNTIGVEMCVEKDGTIHPDTVTRTVAVVAELCKKFKLNPFWDIYRHFDITGKNCPAPWVANVALFNNFRDRVYASVNTQVTAVKKEEDEVEERAIVVGGLADLPAAQLLQSKIKPAGIHFKENAQGTKVGKHVFVVGGTKDGLVADKFTVLSGATRRLTMDAVDDYK